MEYTKSHAAGPSNFIHRCPRRSSDFFYDYTRRLILCINNSCSAVCFTTLATASRPGGSRPKIIASGISLQGSSLPSPFCFICFNNRILRTDLQTRFDISRSLAPPATPPGVFLSRSSWSNDTRVRFVQCGPSPRLYSRANDP
jgi:hypothetical protein